MDEYSSYAIFDGRIIWCGGRGRWSVVVTGDEPWVFRYRRKSAAQRHARRLRSDGDSVRVRGYRRHDVRVTGGHLVPR